MVCSEVHSLLVGFNILSIFFDHWPRTMRDYLHQQWLESFDKLINQHGFAQAWLDRAGCHCTEHRKSFVVWFYCLRLWGWSRSWRCLSVCFQSFIHTRWFHMLKINRSCAGTIHGLQSHRYNQFQVASSSDPVISSLCLLYFLVWVNLHIRYCSLIQNCADKSIFFRYMVTTTHGDPDILFMDRLDLRAHPLFLGKTDNDSLWKHLPANEPRFDIPANHSSDAEAEHPAMSPVSYVNDALWVNDMLLEVNFQGTFLWCRASWNSTVWNYIMGSG